MENEETVLNNKSSLIPKIILGTLALGIMGGGITLVNRQVSSGYKNGSFEAIGNYKSPAGDEDVGIKITLRNGIITEATSDVRATNEKSQYWQKQFSENFSKEIVGKKIDEVKLDRVAGSSLTPKGFKDALDKIKTQARG